MQLSELGAENANGRFSETQSKNRTSPSRRSRTEKSLSKRTDFHPEKKTDDILIHQNLSSN